MEKESAETIATVKKERESYSLFNVEKFQKFNEQFWKFIDKNLFLIFYIIITIFSVVIRSYFMDFVAEDYRAFLQNWFNGLKERRGTFCS